MRGGCVFFGTVAVSILWTTAVFSRVPDLARLHSKRSAILDALSKVENGSDPCFTDLCQTKKFGLISRLFVVSDFVPLADSVFLKGRREGIQAAYDLIRKKFEPPKMKGAFPRSSNEWAYYWKKRSSHEAELQSAWLIFLSQIYALRNGVRIYLDGAHQASGQTEIYEEAWKRGLGEVAAKTIEASELAVDAKRAEVEGRIAEGKALQQRALDLTDERIKLEEQDFKGQYSALVETLLPGTPLKKSIASLSLMKNWIDRFGSGQFLDPEFIQRMTSRYENLKEIYQLAQDFTDLEYGVVGLRNFYSDVNPDVRAEKELVVQEFLNQVESRARDLIEIGTYYFLSKTGSFVFDIKFLSRIAFPTAYSLLSNQKDDSVSRRILKPSQRRAELEQGMEPLKAQLEKRYQELFITRAELKERLEQIDLQISIMNQTEEEHESTKP